MAKYTVTRNCGHEETVALFGKIKGREWRLENVETQKLCTECYQAEMKRLHEEENREAAEIAREMGLPALTGTEKQVAWAELIRQQMLADLDKFIYKQVKIEHRNDPSFLEAVEKIRSRTEARWWIDNRGMNMSWELKYLLEKAANEVKAEKLQPAVDAAKAEATVRTENPVTETVAEIRTLENAIEVYFPERRDDFREVVKGLKFKWSGSAWRREIVPKNGTLADRAAETGHRLLAAGFPVRIFDDGVRKKAISGAYEHECTRWVQLRTGEKYQGWLAISWDHGDDFYGAAKKLPGAHWSKPSVVVPVENFDEVLDFAKMYGFQVSDLTQEAIDQARCTRDATLTVNVAPPKEPEKVIASSRPPVLEVPVEVQVDDEFREEA